MNERGFRILDALDAILRKRHGAKPAEVALAWLIAREGVTAPIRRHDRGADPDSLIRATQLELTARKCGRSRTHPPKSTRKKTPGPLARRGAVSLKA